MTRQFGELVQTHRCEPIDQSIEKAGPLAQRLDKFWETLAHPATYIDFFQVYEGVSDCRHTPLERAFLAFLENYFEQFCELISTGSRATPMVGISRERWRDALGDFLGV